MFKGITQKIKKGAGKSKDFMKDTTATLTRVPTTIVAPVTQSTIFGKNPKTEGEEVEKGGEEDSSALLTASTNIAPRADSDADDGSSSYQESDESYASATSIDIDDKKPSGLMTKFNPVAPAATEKEQEKKDLFWCFILPLVLLLIALVVVTVLVFMGGGASKATQSILPAASLNNNTIQTTAGHSNSKMDEIDMERYNALSDFLIDAGVANEFTLTIEGTPQNDALLWLTDDDPAQVEVDDEWAHIEERYVLAVLYFSSSSDVNNCDDEEDDECDDESHQWLHSENWMSGECVCDWQNVSCDHENNIQKLELRRNNLVGSVPSELSALTLLETLDLSENSLSGTIPVLLTTIEGLSFLSLHGNQLNGAIPDGFFLHPNLETFSAGNNYFTGPLPEQITANNLKVLALEANALSGKIPKSIWSLPHLQVLYLNNNQISGALPSNMDATLSSMKDLRLQYNKLSGNLSPSFISRMPGLEILNLSGNEFKGELFSTAWRSLTKLKELYLSLNKFTGPIPGAFTSPFMNQLEVLFLNNNEFTGSIPEAKITEENDFRLGLKAWWIFENKLTGTLPSHTLWTLQDSLEDFQFQLQANLTGELPTILGSLHKLHHLSGYANHLRGAIPTQLCDLSQLHTLQLYNNDLVGEFPCEGASFKSLELDCGVNGTIFGCES